ncbi:MAG: hypothetical protein Q3976_08670 [Corynebacterium sp.]|nr:hypothetical protein [Corynebacterium sp.]
MPTNNAANEYVVHVPKEEALKIAAVQHINSLMRTGFFHLVIQLVTELIIEGASLAQ